MISVKNIILKYFESWIVKGLIYLTPILFSSFTLYKTQILDKRINKISNPPITTEANHTKDAMHLLSSRCGQWTGMAWAWIKTDEYNRKTLGFNEVIAFDEILNQPRSVYYENEAYRKTWYLSEKAYTILNKEFISSYLLLQEFDQLWEEEPFVSIRPAIWLKSNIRRIKNGLDQILIGNVYVSIVKKYDNIIYIIILTLPKGKQFCTLDKDNDYYNSIDRTGAEVVKIADQLKKELGYN